MKQELYFFGLCLVLKKSTGRIMEGYYWLAASLAHLHIYRGRYEDSELLYVRVIKVFEQLWPPADKPDLLILMTNLALVYSRQRYDAKAYDLYRRVIAGYRSLGARYEDRLLQVEIDLACASSTAQGPGPESWLI